MSSKISRRQMLGIGAATIAGAALSKSSAHAINHGGRSGLPAVQGI